MTKEELLKKYLIQLKDALNDLKTPGNRHKQIPNILTFSRLLSPLAIIPTALSGNTDATIKLSALFGLTDMADGLIARTFNLKSELGADLDALTDKVFAGTLLLTGAISNPCVLVNTGLEGTIAGINLKEKFAGNKPGSTIMGKIKTGAVFTLGGLAIVAPANEKLQSMVIPLSILTATLQTMTVASYLKKYQSNPQEETLDVIPILDELKEESAFLHKELENQQSTLPSFTPVPQKDEAYQKTKTK